MGIHNKNVLTERVRKLEEDMSEAKHQIEELGSQLKIIGGWITLIRACFGRIENLEKQLREKEKKEAESKKP